MAARLRFLILVGLAAVPARAQHWRVAAALSDEAASEQKFGEAASYAETAWSELQRSPDADSPEAAGILAGLAKYYGKTLDVAGLRSTEARLLAFPRKGASAWLALGQLARGERREEAAIQYLRKAARLSHDPEQVGDIDAELGTVYLELGRYAEAARTFEAALSRPDPPRCWAYIKLAGAYHYMGRHDRAREVFARAKKAAPSCYQAYIQEGYGDLEQGRDAEAKKEFQKVVAVDTSSVQGYRHLGSLLYYRGHYREAEAYFRKALAFWPQPPSPVTQDWAGDVMWLGIVLKAEKRPDEAEEAFLRVERRSRGASTDERFVREHALHQLGELYDSVGRDADAERAYEDALAICADPQSCPGFWYADALLGLAGFYAGHGRKPQAADLLARVSPASFSSANPMVFAMRWNLVAGVHEKLGEGKEAADIYRRVLALFPASACGPDLLDSLKGLGRVSSGREAAQAESRLAACRKKLAAAQ